MKRSTMLAVTAATLVCLSAQNAHAQSAKNVLGTWMLVSAISEKDGNKSDTFGAGAKGSLSLDASGHYMITIIGADLPKFASGNRATGTADENKAVVGKSIAHFGTYAVNEADKSITFKPERATFANWDGTEMKRSFTVNADELTYSVAAASAGGTATVTWKRAGEYTSSTR